MKILTCLMIILCLTSPLLATEADEIVDQTLETYQNAGGFIAKLAQTRFMEVLGTSHTVTGTIIMKAPNQFRISYTSPDSQLIVSNGDSVWLYTPDLDQVQIIPLVKSDNFIYQYFTNSDAVRLEDEIVNDINCYQLELTPHTPDQTNQKIKAWVAQDTFLPYQLELTDLNGNRTRYTLNQISTEIPNDPNLFVFEIPEGVDVFR